jgi:hypothetical protein
MQQETIHSFEFRIFYYRVESLDDFLKLFPASKPSEELTDAIARAYIYCKSIEYNCACLTTAIICSPLKRYLRNGFVEKWSSMNTCAGKGSG